MCPSRRYVGLSSVCLVSSYKWYLSVRPTIPFTSTLEGKDVLGAEVRNCSTHRKDADIGQHGTEQQGTV